MFTASPKTKSHLKSTDSIRRQIVGLDVQTPLLNGQNRPYIFFDNAASTPVLREVLTAVNQFMPYYSSVHRGSGLKSQMATRIYDEARHIVGDFFGADPKQHVVIFGKNSTEAINKLSYRLVLTKKDVVLISNMEHHSNDLPWRKTAQVQRIKTDAKGALSISDYERLLSEYRGRVKLVAISGGSNVTGHVPPIHDMAAKAHRSGARILVDCAQLAPHRTVDMKPVSDPAHLDYITVSAHKFYAPFGTGALIGRRDTFEVGEPEFCGGGTIDVVTATDVAWAAPPDRDEAGSPNVVGAMAMAKALKCLSEFGMDEVAAHEAVLTAYALRKLKDIQGVKLLGDDNPETAAGRLGVIPFMIDGMDNALVAAILSAEWGIGVRNGCFCAHPYVTNLLKIPKAEINSFREEVLNGDRRHMPGVVRVSFGIYNTQQEVDVLAQALSSIAKGKYAGTYRQVKTTGDYYPLGWEPDLTRFFSI